MNISKNVIRNRKSNDIQYNVYNNNNNNNNNNKYEKANINLGPQSTMQKTDDRPTFTPLHICGKPRCSVREAIPA